MSVDINDAIHKTITLSDREVEVLDHPYVQRLRSIRELGFVSFVYPSATHDRFSHSLGTLHVASLLAHQIFDNDINSALARILSREEKRFLTDIVRLAGLLHDIGHGPFSHTSENIMPPIDTLAIPHVWLAHPNEKRTATHEDYSVLLIAGMAKGPRAVLTAEEAEIISSLIHHKKISIPESWTKRFAGNPGVTPTNLHMLARSIVSSNIDADRMDYLLRDSHFTGVSYGHFDLPWLIANMGTIEHEGGYYMSISETGVHALEHYLFARYHMYVQVYMHKTVKCFEYYFQKALEEKETSYSIPADQDEYAELHDSVLLENLFRAARFTPKSWSAKLVNRIPSKRIARIWGDEKEAERTFRGLSRELKEAGVDSFLAVSKRKFLDIPDAQEKPHKHAQGTFLFGLAAMPLVIVRKQFGIVTAASMAESSFILKHYHHDISIGDIYVLPEHFKRNADTIRAIAKKYRTVAPSEVIIGEEL